MTITKTVFYVIGCIAMMTAAVSNTQAAGVPIGSSSLIKVLDYSDSFTAYEFGGLEDRDGTNGYPLSTVDNPIDGTPGEGLAVENCYGNAARAWSDSKWSISKDANPINGVTVYPGGSGAGSDTGMTQTGGYHAMWGIEYGLRDRFVVQYDAVQTTDWVGIGFGDIKDGIFVNENVTFLFRLQGNLEYPETGIYNQAIGGVDAGLPSAVTYANEWHNYAALIDIPERTAELFVDEVSIGTIDFDTVAEGAFAGVTLSNATVNVGFWTWDGDRYWTDNFQVGSPDEIQTVYIPGDATRDGKVNDADAAIVSQYWGTGTPGTPATWGQGNFNADYVVDAADAALLTANWGYGVSEGNPVPEPGVFALLTAGLMGLGLRRRRR